LLSQFSTEPFIELYGCWTGEEAEPAKLRINVPLSRLRDVTFCFRERGYYKVQIAPS
jgi:hypothetical protein